MTTSTPDALARAQELDRSCSGARHLLSRKGAICVDCLARALTEQAREIERLKIENAADRVRLGLAAHRIERVTWEAAKVLMLAEASYTSAEGDRSWRAEVEQFARYVAELFDARASAQRVDNG